MQSSQGLLRAYTEGVVSGRYVGSSVFPASGSYYLDLRVGVDKRYDNSLIMNRIIGDIYRIQNMMDIDISHDSLAGSHLYLESWIVDNPIVTDSALGLEIRVPVRYWKGNHSPTALHIVIFPTSSSSSSPFK
jgi:hypothetical protein